MPSMMNKSFFQNLGAFMKWTAGLALGASFFLGACATSAMGDEVVVRTNNGDGQNRVIRMVVDEVHRDGEETRMCVFVPAGNEETAGALSCSGAEFQVIELTDGGNVFFSGDTVLSEDDLARMIEDRLAEINDRIAEAGELRFEFQDLHLESEEFAREMEELAREMEEIHIEFTAESEEERAELAQEMQELAREMEALHAEGQSMDSAEMAALSEEMDQLAREMDSLHTELWVERRGELTELQREMAITRAEAMAEFAAEMARMREEGALMEGVDGSRVIFSGPGGHTRLMLRSDSHWVSDDGPLATIERTTDADGESRIVIRTTDPSRIEVIQVSPEELGDVHFGHDEE